MTPEALRDVEFRKALSRGYHQDDVDEFLERMAAGMEILGQRIREATERAVRAEQARPASGQELPQDEAGMRALLIESQHAADRALDEAREHARRLVQVAEQYAAALVSEARAAGTNTRASVRGQAETDLGRLRVARDRLRVQAIAIERHVLGSPVPTPQPSWPTCLHAVEQIFAPFEA
jgi:cell division initiation protein